MTNKADIFADIFLDAGKDTDESNHKLRRTHRTPEYSFTTDGFRLHAVKMKNETPDLSILAQSVAGIHYEEVVMRVGQLRRALVGHDDAVMVALRIYSIDPVGPEKVPPVELYFENSAFAAVMPTIASQFRERWRPYNP